MVIELTNYALAIVKYFDGLLFIFDITIIVVLLISTYCFIYKEHLFGVISPVYDTNALKHDVDIIKVSDKEGRNINYDIKVLQE